MEMVYSDQNRSNFLPKIDEQMKKNRWWLKMNNYCTFKTVDLGAIGSDWFAPLQVPENDAGMFETRGWVFGFITDWRAFFITTSTSLSKPLAYH